MLNFTKHRQNREQGDTLIEVLFAITVFSFIVVTALSLMNQGVAAAQRSLEITTVRQQMDGQAETLRFLHESYVEAYQSGLTYDTADAVNSPAEEYYKIIQFANGGRTAASTFGSADVCQTPDIGRDFILNPVAATFVNNSRSPGIFEKATTFSQLSYTSGGLLSHSQGMWIEPVRSSNDGTSAGYIDFHIRACWGGPGSNIPMNLGTIVRLYEPRG